jgi:prophage regulatory protein
MEDSAAKFMLKEYEQLHRLCMMQSRLLQRVGQPAKPESGERLIRLPEVLKRCGISKRTVSRLEAAGRFPTRRQLGPRAVGWAETEISAWIHNPTGWEFRAP